MYAVTFFTIISYSLKADGENYRMLANIYSLPHLTPAQSRNVLRMLDNYGEKQEVITQDRIQKDREKLRQLMTSPTPL